LFSRNLYISSGDKTENSCCVVVLWSGERQNIGRDCQFPTDSSLLSTCLFSSRVAKIDTKPHRPIVVLVDKMATKIIIEISLLKFFLGKKRVDIIFAKTKTQKQAYVAIKNGGATVIP
jgi:hypothetical protein